MPTYAFHCSSCGPFEEGRRMAEAGAPAHCPRCQGEARRVFTPPGLARMARPLRRVLDHEERSAHEPAVVDQPRGGHLPHRHAPAPPWVLSH